MQEIDLGNSECTIVFKDGEREIARLDAFEYQGEIIRQLEEIGDDKEAKKQDRKIAIVAVRAVARASGELTDNQCYAIGCHVSRRLEQLGKG